MELSNSTKEFMRTEAKRYLDKNDLQGLLQKIADISRYRNQYGLVAGGTANELVAYFQSRGLNLFDYLDKIPAGIFSNPPKEFCITQLDIGDHPEVIQPKAFESMPKLTSVKIGSSLASIGTEAFANCPALTQLELGENVTAIGKGAFSNTGLKQVYLPESITMIGAKAFPEDCYLVSPRRKKRSLRFPKNELEWFKKHLVLDPSLKDTEGEAE